MNLTAARPRLLHGVVACGLLLVVWYLTLAPARIGGPMIPVIVRGSSMLPTYEAGDLVVAYRVREAEPGQVAVFPGPSGGYVIHRIVAVDGDLVITQGDNRSQTDPWPTTTADVLGVARLHLPGVGALLLRVADPLVIASFAGAVAASVVLWPRRQVGADPLTASGSVALIAVLVAGPVIGMAAGMTVTADRVMSVTLTGPFDTYVDTPGGGGGGGCNGQGNRPGC